MRSDDAPVVRHFGAWMLALTADFEDRPDRAMAELDAVMTSPAADRPAYAGLIDPADAPVLVRMALRAGRHERAAQAVALAEKRAALNPGLPSSPPPPHTPGAPRQRPRPLVRAVRLHEDCPGHWPGRRRWRTPDASWRPPARRKRSRTSRRPSRSTPGRAPDGTSRGCAGACGPPASAAGPPRPDSPTLGPS
ncbi:hypothetical protein O1L60_34500 [Streptomyces diastatochromogenes]|nr:hypothetical protein [Streptomyces diastatochromogenes]